MRTITILVAAGLALTSTVAFAREGEQRFTHQGSTYIYTTSTDHGRTVISGRRLPAGDTFRLVVDGDRVTGEAGGMPVAFRTASAKGAAGGVQVAAN